LSPENQPAPTVSVVLPVYDGASWLGGAIQCVLDQSFTDFELLIIDDGSEDASWAIISSFQDSRIKARRRGNAGLAATLNECLQWASGTYVARQDQDDWMHPERLARQVAFMVAHPECAAVGTWAEIREGDARSQRRHEHALSNEALCLGLLFDNPFVHSSMLFRREAVLAVGGYCEDKARQPPEDYELWSRLATRFELANIGEVLTAYREVAGSMSRSGVSPFQRNVLRISAENLARVLPTYTESECHALSLLYHGSSRDSQDPVVSRKKALAMLRQAADAIAGERPGWADEFAQVYDGIAKRLAAQSVRRHFPRAVLNMARKIKRALS